MSKPQLYLFTGENAFQLREEKRMWRDQFASKHGPENLIEIDGNHLTWRALLDEIAVAPFIAEKRLVIVNGVPKLTKEQVEQLPREIHQDCVLTFWEPKLDKRLSASKALLQTATVKEYAPLSGGPLLAWVKKEAERHGASLGDPAADALIAIVGEDQLMLSHEIAKMSLAASTGGSTLTREIVAEHAVPSGEQEVWQLSHLLSAGDATGALTYARSLLRKGEDPHSLWAVLLWLLRSLVSVYAAVQAGERNPARIASTAKVPFPTARSLQPLASRMDGTALRAFVDEMTEADLALKTGGFRATGDAPQELLALIDRFITEFASLSERDTVVAR